MFVFSVVSAEPWKDRTAADKVSWLGYLQNDLNTCRDPAYACGLPFHLPSYFFFPRPSHALHCRDRRQGVGGEKGIGMLKSMCFPRADILGCVDSGVGNDGCVFW
jgi:hypothetical protein